MNIILKILTYWFYLINFFNRKIFIKNIKKGDLVLDVGSGDKPFWRADVIVDKFLEDDQQRISGGIVYDKNKIFVEADVESLPFKDKAFDFVFCSHLLEHVVDPDKAIRELTRVAKNGYIEVPRYTADFLCPFPPHLWFCDYKDGILIFTQKEKQKNFYLEGIEKFGSKLLNTPLFSYLLAKYSELVVIRHYWKEDVKYKVIKSENPHKYTYKKNVTHVKNLMTKVTFALYGMIYVIICSVFYKKKDINLSTLLKNNYGQNK